ncbi:HEPN domain-containing protein [Comamonas composti]|uniref:HEPN domain-containing protein n=1 Tax=Comamonas composti TaxID=408558 RepID=UPI00047CD531|nr:HEPN domain-containing protein [Comamonas composti]
MFSYSFAVKLTDRSIDKQSSIASFQSDGGDIKVERKEDDILLISSDGYSCEEDALKQLAAMLMKAKITLLKLRIPHQDWLLFNTSQRFATEAIGSFFEERKIVAVSYKPQVYETRRFQHWPGATPAGAPFNLEILSDIALPEDKFNFGTARTLEALNVLGLALADPHAKSKLILAMTAVEILSDRECVEKEVADALDNLKEKIAEVKATSEMKDRLANLLEGAKIETISKAGKRLVRKVLGGARAKEFYKLYDVRSELVHGNSSRLSIDLNGHAEIEKYAEEGFNLALDLILNFHGSATSNTSS